jgi:hypothetical protein
VKRLVLCLALVGCTQQPDNTQPVKVTFVASSAEVKSLCGKDDVLEGFGCAKQSRSSINPGGACEIVAVKPRGFDDGEAVKTLGHELLHCLWGPVHI